MSEKQVKLSSEQIKMKLKGFGKLSSINTNATKNQHTALQPEIKTISNNKNENDNDNKIKIEYNPYNREFSIYNGANKNEKISQEYGKKPCDKNVCYQLLEQIINEHGITYDVVIEFIGIVEHFELFQSIVSQVEDIQRIKISLTHTKLSKPSEMLDKVIQVFDGFCKEDWLGLDVNLDDTKEEFKELTKPNVEINVIATMSSGKSTLINALLGNEILPAANEATTATVLRFYDTDNTDKIMADRFGENAQILEQQQDITVNTANTLKEWNNDKSTKEIHLYGELNGIESQSHSRLVLVDTPGPNNSQDSSHQKATHEILQKIDNSVVLYVLNATQLGINDDYELLRHVREAMSIDSQAHDKFIFVINKIDGLDVDKNESIEKTIERVKSYLKNTIGIENPNCYPVSAITSLLVRKSLKGIELTPREIRTLNNNTASFVEEPLMHLEQYMPLSVQVKQNVRDKLALARSDEEKALIHSGIPIIEEVINEYLEKYAFPKRVSNLIKVFDKILSTVRSNAELKLQVLIDSSQARDNKLSELSSIQDKVKQISEDTATKLSKLDDIDEKLKKTIYDVRFKAENDKRSIIDSLQNQRTTNKRDGEKYFNDAKKKLTDIFAKISVNYETLIVDDNDKLIENVKNGFIIDVQKILGQDDLLNSVVMNSVAITNFDPDLKSVSANVEKETIQVEEKYIYQKRRLGFLWKYDVEGVRVVDKEIEVIDCYNEAQELEGKFNVDLDKLQGNVGIAIMQERERFITNLRDVVKQKLSKYIESIRHEISNIEKMDKQTQNEQKEPLMMSLNKLKTYKQSVNYIN